MHISFVLLIASLVATSLGRKDRIVPLISPHGRPRTRRIIDRPASKITDPPLAQPFTFPMNPVVGGVGVSSEGPPVWRPALKSGPPAMAGIENTPQAIGPGDGTARSGVGSPTQLRLTGATTKSRRQVKGDRQEARMRVRKRAQERPWRLAAMEES